MLDMNQSGKKLGFWAMIQDFLTEVKLHINNEE